LPDEGNAYLNITQCRRKVGGIALKKERTIMAHYELIVIGAGPVSNTRTGAIGAPLCAAKGIYHCFNVKRSIIAEFLRFRADGKRHADKTHFIQGDKIAARVCNDSNPVHMVSSVVVENLLSVFEKPI